METTTQEFNFINFNFNEKNESTENAKIKKYVGVSKNSSPKGTKIKETNRKINLLFSIIFFVSKVSDNWFCII